MSRDALSGMLPADPDPDAVSASMDWARIAAHLADHGYSLDRSVSPVRLAGGLANINLLLAVDGGRAVLRRPPPGDLPAGAHDMGREHRVLAGLKGRLRFAPDSFHFCADPTVAGVPFQLLRFYDGRSVSGDGLGSLPRTPDTGRGLSELLVDTLGRPEGFVARNAKGWIGRARAACGNGLCPDAAWVAAWLQESVPAETRSPTLLHNDFKLDNILLRHDRLDPLVVLDWDMATRGDPLCDLAILLSYWTEPSDPDCMHRLRQMPTARAGFWTREEAAAAYAVRSGRPLDGMRYARVLATFRLAVIFHQLHARYAAERTTDPEKQGYTALADEIFAFAATIARGERF